MKGYFGVGVEGISKAINVGTLFRTAHAFGAAFVEKLAIFALRRTMTVDDRPHLAKIAAQAKSADYRLVDTIEALVMSELFKRR